MAESMRAAKANPPRRRAKKGRRNPPTPNGVPVKQFTSNRGHLVSRKVLALEYFNVGSVQDTPYRHDFESDGVELWALADGSLLIRHPRHRLWDDFIVRDGE